MVVCYSFFFLVINMHGFLFKEQIVSDSQSARLWGGSELIIFQPQVESFLDRDLNKRSSSCFDPDHLPVSSASKTITVSAGGGHLGASWHLAYPPELVARAPICCWAGTEGAGPSLCGAALSICDGDQGHTLRIKEMDAVCF